MHVGKDLWFFQVDEFLVAKLFCKRKWRKEGFYQGCRHVKWHFPIPNLL